MTAPQPSDDAPAAVLERHGHTALITLNRPRALNAVNAELSAAAGAALKEFAADSTLRVAVLTGAGRAFCAGMDLKAAAAGLPVMAPGNEEWGFGGVVSHWVDKPLIAAVNGHALGGGAEIVLACDLAVADENAVIGLPEVRRGLIPGAAGAVRLPRLIPRNAALEMLLTGEPITAATAARWGLVNRVAPAGKSVEVALELAEAIAAGAPLALGAVKRLVHASPDLGSDWESKAWAENDREWQGVSASADALEGPRAFVEKRPPRWTGR
ncbi:crotonase/enoyl-CoA hydratase family protein [Streptomyces ferrugineus]|uniref:Crotonase/enoyl-CoA hydratase family protein n=1 Tax=Streptomyces ferrugineus TaxID=1413221 RepID=A0A7M2SB03_9ACTN|nr:crotonase/enoyl-CoA hydratase family protein [Streptomyces ferrugineus]QOV33199.1 crotonase/enoyl-CoA hydratase family protein [Streptomyces ferrugineus]